MNFWVELHCSNGLKNPGCANMNHDYSQGFFSNFTEARSELTKKAKKYGWKVKGKEIYCPSCAIGM